MRIQGIEYTPTRVQEIIEEVETLRAEAFSDGNLEELVLITHVLAYLKDYLVSGSIKVPLDN